MELHSTNIKYMIGDAVILENMDKMPAYPIFDQRMITCLGKVSNDILTNPAAKQYPDVVTFGFWCRKASITGMKEQYDKEQIRIGRGIVFHIAPSNVAVNFAYSLAAGMLAGNASVVRLPSKNFEQVELICNALRNSLTPELEPYLCLVRYGHEQEITDTLSTLCDIRIIWGGDHTIEEIRRSKLKPRASEITFADRFSIFVIDADSYRKEQNKKNIALGFYQDTYLTDQNACTSPRLVVWLGKAKKEAQTLFWNELYTIVKEKYELLPSKAVGKYTGLCILAASGEPVHQKKLPDNFIMRIKADSLSENLMKIKGNCGSFLEYEAEKLSEILPVCSPQCQTLSYYGVAPEEINQLLLAARPRGIDRIVPIGKTMDFSLIWDGYDLIREMSRVITVR